MAIAFLLLSGWRRTKSWWGDSPIPSVMENPVHFTCIFENACKTSLVMSHKCNCMAFVIDVLFSIRLQVTDFSKRVETIGLFGSFIQHTKFSFQSDLNNNKKHINKSKKMACYGLMGSGLDSSVTWWWTDFQKHPKLWEIIQIKVSYHTARTSYCHVVYTMLSVTYALQLTGDWQPLTYNACIQLDSQLISQLAHFHQPETSRFTLLHVGEF